MKFGFGSNKSNCQPNTSDVNAINTQSQDNELIEGADRDRFYNETRGKPCLSNALSGVDDLVLIDDKTHVNLDLLNDELLLTEFKN